MLSKTPITVLQELAVKKQCIPHFEMLEPTDGVFSCKASALGVDVIGRGRNKKDAKQDAARLVLEKLVQKGLYIPKACDNFDIPNTSTAAQEILLNNVGILKDLCCNFRMPQPEFDCISETGLPHSKQFTIQVKVGSLERTAMASTKKIAKQLAAEKLVEYFKENMGDRIAEFNEETAASEALNDKAEKMYVDQTEVTWKPNLGQIIANYHYGLKEIIGKDVTEKAIEYFMTIKDSLYLSHIEKLLQILNLEHDWEKLPSESSRTTIVLKIQKANPPAYFVGSNTSEESAKNIASKEALDYFMFMLSA